MSDQSLDPVMPGADEPKNDINKIIIAVVIAIILCVCLCLCVFLMLPTLLGPTIGNVFSDIEYQLLTPIPYGLAESNDWVSFTVSDLIFDNQFSLNRR